MFVRLRLPVLLLLAAGFFTGGWWLGKNSAAGPAQRSAHAATAQLLPPSARPPGYLTSKAPPAPPAAGAEALAKLLEQRAKPEDLATALAAWAEQEPDAAFRALLADPRLQLPATARALFEVLGKNDPAQALQRLAQLPAVPWALDANKGLATGWTRGDPKACAAAGLALPPSIRRVDFLAATFAQWAKQDFLAAHAWVMHLPPEESRPYIVTAEALDEAEVHNAQEMTAHLDFQLPLYAFSNEAPPYFKRWVEKSPEAALEWALALSPKQFKSADFLSEALKPMAADPSQVLTLLPQLKDEWVQKRLLSSAASAWVQRDPASAWAWSAQLKDPALREHFESNLSYQWTALDPDTAIPWLMKNHQASRLGESNIEPLERWVETAPDAAMAMLDQLPAENVNKDLPTILLSRLASKQPEITLAHLDLLQTKEARSTVLFQAMDYWSQRDITAASTYTEALPPGEDRQAAIRGILVAAFKESPESALTWASTLTDPKKRAESVSQFFEGWRKKDPAAAQNWLDHAPLDNALRQILTPSQP